MIQPETKICVCCHRTFSGDKTVLSKVAAIFFFFFFSLPMLFDGAWSNFEPWKWSDNKMLWSVITAPGKELVLTLFFPKKFDAWKARWGFLSACAAEWFEVLGFLSFPAHIFPMFTKVLFWLLSQALNITFGLWGFKSFAFSLYSKRGCFRVSYHVVKRAQWKVALRKYLWLMSSYVSSPILLLHYGVVPGMSLGINTRYGTGTRRNQ